MKITQPIQLRGNMIALIQRVSWATVSVEGKTIAEIKKGILALVGIEKTDTEKQVGKLIDKILNYRIFEDTAQKMNLSLRDIKGDLLLVSQFTLVADTHSGTRPGFSTAMPPTDSKVLFHTLVTSAKKKWQRVESGEFGAHMQISLCNDGPVTFSLNS